MLSREEAASTDEQVELNFGESARRLACIFRLARSRHLFGIAATEHVGDSVLKTKFIISIYF